MKLCKMLKGICDNCGDKETCATRRQIFEVKKKPDLTATQKVVEHFKAIKKVSPNDKTWDKRNFPRFSKNAKELLSIFSTLERAKSAISIMDKMFSVKGLMWNLSTVVKWSDTLFVELEKKELSDKRRAKHKEHIETQKTLDEEHRKNACPMPDEFKKALGEVADSMKFPS